MSIISTHGHRCIFIACVQLDPMALAVLNDAQARAVEYVINKSKVDSERRYPELKSKVERLGYSEKDLERYCPGMGNGICCVVCCVVCSV